MESYEYELIFENAHGERYKSKREYILPKGSSKEQVDDYAYTMIMNDEELQRAELISYKRIMYDDIPSSSPVVMPNEVVIEPTPEEKEVDIDFNTQDVVNIYPSGNNMSLTKVSILKPEDLVSGNIRKDKEIFGVIGSLETETIDLQEKEAVPNDEVQIITADTGYDGLKSVTVKEVNCCGTVEVDEIDFSNENVARVTPLTGYSYMQEVVINKDENLLSENIRSGVTIDGIEGTLEEGYQISVENDTLVFCDGVSIEEGELII